MTDYWKDVDTILMGRKTYDFAQAQSPSASRKPKKQPAKSDPAGRTKPAMRTYVFSRTLPSVHGAGVELVSGDAVEFVRRLKQQPGKRICLMGGGELAQSLLAAGLVDQVGLNIHPILLGSGIPTFRDPGRRVKLELTTCRQLEGGCILAQYSVIHTS
jgi:dihydrofolate reductase